MPYIKNCVGPRRWVITIVLSGAKHSLFAGCVSTSPHRLLYGGRLHVSLCPYTLNFLALFVKNTIKLRRLNSFETAFGNCDSAHRRAHPP